MKKTSIFIVSTALAFALTGCDDEFQNSQNDKGEVSENSTEQMYQTVFLTGDDITRTTLDENRKFYWTSGDVLWVDDPENTGKFVASTPLKFTEEKKDYAQFTVYKSFPAAITETQVYYTGQGSSSTANGLKVTIKKYQTQTAPNDGSHLATDGDCGTVKATRQTNGGFTFSLVHKAAYLLIYPYIDDSMGPDVTLKRITISSTGSDDLTGTFSFTSAGLAQTADDGTGGKSITFYCDFTTPKPYGYGDDWRGFQFPRDPDNPENNKNSLADVGCYVVFHPGNHKLTLTYTYETTGEYEKREEFSIVRTLDEDVRPYEANTVRKVQHKTSHYDTYFTWDAEKWFGNGVVSYSTAHLQSHSPRPLETTADDGRWCNTTTVTNTAAAVATHSAATMPCFNAITWYLSTALWDNDQEWRYFGRNGQAGVWLKKWEYIEGTPAGSTPLNCATRWSGWYSGSSGNYIYFKKGKPADDVIDQYFFLPALGQNNRYSGSNVFRLENHGSTSTERYCFYWTSSPTVTNGDLTAYYLHCRRAIYPGSGYAPNFSPSLNEEVGYAYCYPNGSRSINGCVAGVRPDGTPWFQ